MSSPVADLTSQLRYGSGRLAAIVSQAGIAIVLTRSLDRDDLGLFSFVFVFSAIVGMLTGLSARRLVMHRDRDRDASDIVVAVLVAGLLGIAVTALAAGGLGASLGWSVGVAVGVWRLSDAIAEIGQGWLCLDGRFGVSGALQACRSLGTFAGVASGVMLGSWVGGLALAGAIRFSVALAEIGVSEPVLRRLPTTAEVARSTFEGLRFSSINCAILAVEALPTAGVSFFGGLAEAALLTPLGRFRQGLHVAAGSLSEVTYPAMIRAGSNLRTQSSVFLGNALLLGVVIAAGLVFAALDGGAFVFGSILVGERGTVSAAVIAGAGIGFTTLYSSTLTARNLVGIQVVLFTIYALLVCAGHAMWGWTAEMMYLLQGGAGLLVLVAFVAWDWNRSHV